MKTIYWVGLESKSSPNGHGEDYREYVTVENNDERGKLLQAAIMRWAKVLTVMDDGDRIAVHKVSERG